MRTVKTRTSRRLRSPAPARQTAIELSERDSLALDEALRNPKPANENLRKAAERYKALMGNANHDL